MALILSTDALSAAVLAAISALADAGHSTIRYYCGRQGRAAEW
ncbi:hypothetical protein EKH55_0338 [Sinorhizobium alkalisoli]|nr:hypothetical protein EKH55_0338 [Sinorhizobium alkalisoli]